MKIDEAVFERAFGPDPVEDEHASALWRHLHASVEAYLRRLPSAEPGRDRIASLTSALGALVDADVCYSDRDIVIRCACPNEAMHKVLEARLALAKARPAEPVKVEGSVEGVG